MSRSGTYAMRDGHLVRVSTRIPTLRPVETDARDSAAVRQSLLKGYSALERTGNLTRKGDHLTDRQVLKALKD